MNKRQIALIVLDGWGYREERKNNAILEANKPNYDHLWATYPHCLLDASGLAVGLPEGQMGNSEVGHMTIGAGKVLDQDLVRITKTIKNGEFSDNGSFSKLFKHVKDNDSYLHVMGLVSDGGVHSHIDHLLAFLDLAKKNNINKIAIHVFTDGRDVPPESASMYIRKLEDEINTLGVGFISSVSGRYFAMDRDKNWDRISKAKDAIENGMGSLCEISPSLYIQELYKKGETDEYIVPFICKNNEGQIVKIDDNDGVFIFNFRADRARQITKTILDDYKDRNVFVVTMTDYGEDYKTEVAFAPIKIETTLAKEISENGFTQAHIAETEKFAHATYFLNGGMETVYKGEEDVLVPSRKDIPTYDLAPQMSASKIADEAVKKIEEGVDFIFINFANADMVGHTAKENSIIEAIEEVDRDLGRVVDAISKRGGVVCITADHGNAEINIDPKTGEPHTSHTTNPVPFIITDKGVILSENGTLADVAPTIFSLFGIKKPESMTGDSLIK